MTYCTIRWLGAATPIIRGQVLNDAVKVGFSKHMPHAGNDPHVSCVLPQILQSYEKLNIAFWLHNIFPATGTTGALGGGSDIILHIVCQGRVCVQNSQQLREASAACSQPVPRPVVTQ